LGRGHQNHQKLITEENRHVARESRMPVCFSAPSERAMPL